MKPTIPHDPLDELIAAALHGELSPEERTQFESRLNNDPAAQAAFQEAKAMHDLLEKTHRDAQPDAAFEQRMISGVRRKLQQEQHRETAWESLLFIWRTISRAPKGIRLGHVLAVLAIMVVLAGVALGPITHGIKQSKGSAEMQQRMVMISGVLNPNYHGGDSDTTAALDSNDLKKVIQKQGIDYAKAAKTGRMLSGYVDKSFTNQFAGRNQELTASGGVAQTAGELAVDANGAPDSTVVIPSSAPGSDRFMRIHRSNAPSDSEVALAHEQQQQAMAAKADANRNFDVDSGAAPTFDVAVPTTTVTAPAALPANVTQNGAATNADVVREFQYPNTATAAPAPADNRKLIRNANLDLEVTSYQDTVDKITALTKTAGGYVDTSHSEKGGNGKLQGTVVVKVLPENLDAFLLKLRDLGTVQNQSVGTEDVTKEYVDTQARLVNSQKMEVQLQELLKRENGKVADLLQVERELGRVRGDIEQMQGELKLYDFQVQYATVTMQIAEKDLKQAAAYLLKEQDDFSLYATDVEETFQKSRAAAETLKGQVLVATLNHNSGSDVSALLVVSVPPEQIDAFLAQIRSLGRVANFTRDTKRVAKDGGDSNQPADATQTEKDKIMVNVSIHSDDESRKQVALTVVTKAVDTALDDAKTAALSKPGVEILRSSLNKAAERQSTAQLSVRVPGKDYAALMESLRALGRTQSLTIQRNDNSGPGASGDDAPVIVSLSLTDNDTPVQQTDMSVLGSNVNDEAQQMKKAASNTGVEVKASSFERSPDGTEQARMTFRMPMAKYAGFVESLKRLGKVESLSVKRDDRPDETRADDTAPAEINLTLHNQRDIVADNGGLWATIRQTFGEGATALFSSVRTIGVIIAFLAPWVVTLLVLAWIARRIYLWRKR